MDLLDYESIYCPQLDTGYPLHSLFWKDYFEVEEVDEGRVASWKEFRVAMLRRPTASKISWLPMKTRGSK